MSGLQGIAYAFATMLTVRLGIEIQANEGDTPPKLFGWLLVIIVVLNVFALWDVA